MTTPNLALSEVPSSSLQPSVPINDALQVLDALTRPGGIVQDKDLITPPTTTAGDVGKRWIIPASATGAWASKTGQIALCTAATVWRYFTPTEGWAAYVLDEDAVYAYSGSAWAVAGGAVSSVNTRSGAVTLTAADTPSTINTQTASYTAVLTDAGKWIDMNVATANTLTIPPNSTAAFAIGAEIHARVMGVGLTTLTPGAGVTIRKPSSQSLVLKEQWSVASVKKIGTDEWTAFGHLT